ncbi:MAG: putative membrane protein [Alphaproteobacteria bacterium]|jgi:uncharacterized membrane protein
MKNLNKILSIATLTAMAATIAAAPAAAEGGKEKCYGVSKAGKNDCGAGRISCAGSAKVDADGAAFIVVPKGLCERLATGSLEAGE